ncbi:MAG: helix-turn-helix transcriptional regulator [Anaerosacchariphilus sp.]
MGDKFNENLKTAREKKNMTQKEVADSIGVAKSTYSLYESGNREPNVQTIKKIADTLNVSADDLLGLNEQPTTMAAHFDGDEYTEAELEDIRAYAEFVKNRRNGNK